MTYYLMKDNEERETVEIGNDSQSERQTMKNERQQGMTDMTLEIKTMGNCK